MSSTLRADDEEVLVDVGEARVGVVVVVLVEDAEELVEELVGAGVGLGVEAVVGHGEE